MKSRLVSGWPSDQFQCFRPMVTVLSPSDQVMEVNRLSCGFTTDLAPSPAYTSTGHIGLSRFTL